MKYLLKFSVHLVNISEPELDVGVNNPNIGHYLKMQCVGCNKLQTKMIIVVSDVTWSDIKKALNNMIKIAGKKFHYIDISSDELYDYDEVDG